MWYSAPVQDAARKAMLAVGHLQPLGDARRKFKKGGHVFERWGVVSSRRLSRDGFERGHVGGRRLLRQRERLRPSIELVQPRQDGEVERDVACSHAFHGVVGLPVVVEDRLDGVFRIHSFLRGKHNTLAWASCDDTLRLTEIRPTDYHRHTFIAAKSCPLRGEAHGRRGSSQGIGPRRV